MEKETNYVGTRHPIRIGSNKALLIGAVGGIAALAWLTLRERNHQRRYADRYEERRNPMHFFLAGKYPRRRKIDVSGQRPLFERRQSVYDAY